MPGRDHRHAPAKGDGDKSRGGKQRQSDQERAIGAGKRHGNEKEGQDKEHVEHASDLLPLLHLGHHTADGRHQSGHEAEGRKKVQGHHHKKDPRHLDSLQWFQELRAHNQTHHNRQHPDEDLAQRHGYQTCRLAADELLRR